MDLIIAPNIFIAYFTGANGRNTHAGGNTSVTWPQIDSRLISLRRSLGLDVILHSDLWICKFPFIGLFRGRLSNRDSDEFSPRWKGNAGATGRKRVMDESCEFSSWLQSSI